MLIAGVVAILLLAAAGQLILTLLLARVWESWATRYVPAEAHLTADQYRNAVARGVESHLATWGAGLLPQHVGSASATARDGPRELQVVGRATAALASAPTAVGSGSPRHN